MGASTQVQLGEEASAILTAALALPLYDRERLVSRLIETLNESNEPELSDEQVNVLRRRSEEMRSGKVAGILADEAMQMAKSAVSDASFAMKE
jgi:putative addiction module component (TIGR02574 family)